MTQSDFVKIVGGVVIGAAAAAVALGFGITFAHDTKTSIYLAQNGSACTLNFKDPLVHVGKNKKVTWEVINSCTNGSQTISLGNFRQSEQPTATDCTNPTQGSIPYPFTKPDLTDRTVVVPQGENTGNGGIKPGSKSLPLKVENKDEVIRAYYFDICLGGQKADPRLIVER